MKTRKLTISALFIAIGALAGQLIYIPIGASKCFPVQHTINVLLCCVIRTVVWCYECFCYITLRNFMGTRFFNGISGSMVGALLAGQMYHFTKIIMLLHLVKVWLQDIRRLLAVPIAVFIMVNVVGAFAYVIPF